MGEMDSSWLLLIVGVAFLLPLMLLGCGPLDTFAELARQWQKREDAWKALEPFEYRGWKIYYTGEDEDEWVADGPSGEREIYMPCPWSMAEVIDYLLGDEDLEGPRSLRTKLLLEMKREAGIPRQIWRQEQ